MFLLATVCSYSQYMEREGYLEAKLGDGDFIKLFKRILESTLDNEHVPPPQKKQTLMNKI